MKITDREHLDKVRERFTCTTEAFAQCALARGMAEGERLAAMALTNFAPAETAVDLACGPGTFARSFAAHLQRVVGVDFTPAMLRRAERTMAEADRQNVHFICADVNSLPFADGAFDVATCGYAMHHLLNPGGVIREMARVIRRGGRVAIVDPILPDGADGELHNRIERVRDPSHASVLPLAELQALFAAAGFRMVATDVDERERDFDEWMRVAGSAPGAPAYVETRRLLESTLASDAAGLRPRFQGPAGALTLTQHAVFLVAEKA